MIKAKLVAGSKLAQLVKAKQISRSLGIKAATSYLKARGFSLEAVVYTLFRK